MASLRKDEPTNAYLDDMSDMEYKKDMGFRKIEFKPIPEDYYPLTCCEVILYSFFVVGIIVTMLAVMIGFLFWVLDTGLEVYTIVWSIVFCVFVFFMIIAFYVGGSDRIREEKRLIQEAQEKQEAVLMKARALKDKEHVGDKEEHVEEV